MQRWKGLGVVAMIVATLSWLSQAQVPTVLPTGGPSAGAPGMGNPQVQSSHCQYLINAPSPWGTNASPFKLFTRSYSGEIKRGYPVEVSILPFYDAFKFFNFTDFALWAEPVQSTMATAPPLEVEVVAASVAPAGPAFVSHLGVWQVFPQYAGGASSMKCNIYTKGEDTVGSFEERMLELLKTQFPFDGRLLGFAPSARHGAAFLWYPDERTVKTATAVKFIAKVKSFGQWFMLESTPWKVFRPPPPRPMNTMGNWNTFIDQYSNMNQRAITMERQMEQAGNGAI